MDPELQSLVQAAETDALLPLIRVIAGNQLIIGRPTSTATFISRSEEAVTDRQEGFERKNLGRKEQDLAPQRAAENVAAKFKPWTDARSDGRPDEYTVLTLGQAHLWPLSGGDGLALPVLRVPLSAVDAWWLDGASTLSAGSGGGWFVGAAFPIPLGN
jgi:hypothetical protein